MVKGSRCSHTVHFKGIYPETGGGEDIDFIFQMKELYGGDEIVVGVLGARAAHPWWRGGNVCFKQIMGWWANAGDSICLTEWPPNTFLDFPHWIECIMLSVFALPFLSCGIGAQMQCLLVVASLDHLWRIWLFYPSASCSGSNKLHRSVVAALGRFFPGNNVSLCYFQKDVILLLYPSDGLVRWSSTYRGSRLPDSKWNSVFVVLLGLLVLCLPVGCNLDGVLIMVCSFESKLCTRRRETGIQYSSCF
jgi:hypothetical protein